MSVVTQLAGSRELASLVLEQAPLTTRRHCLVRVTSSLLGKLCTPNLACSKFLKLVFRIQNQETSHETGFWVLLTN